MLSITRSRLLTEPTTQPFFLLEKRTLYSSTSAPSNSSGRKMRDCVQRCSVVASDEDRVSGEQKSGFFVAKIDVVDRSGGADTLAHPRLAAIVRTAQETVVAANPSSLAVNKVDGVEIAAACADLVRNPATLRAYRGYENQPHNDEPRIKFWYSYVFIFAFCTLVWRRKTRGKKEGAVTGSRSR